MVELIGITRERLYSPGRVDDDAAILHQVADELRRRSQTASVVDGDATEWPQPSAAAIVFAMAQGPRALERMRQWQRLGIRVINAPDAILNCHRHRTVALLQDADVGFPQTTMVDSDPHKPLPPWARAGEVWIKRGDVHATEDGDVRQAEGSVLIAAALQSLRERGVARAAIQRHVPGTVLKFYGVRGGFFHCVPPASGPPPSAALRLRLAAVAERAAFALGVEVFGGDCVVTANDSLHIIDLNDWPSYRACRAEAAAAIASYLISQQAEGKL